MSRQVFLTILLTLLTSCRQGIIFDPDFHVADHSLQGIVSERGEIIKCDDPRFDEYAAMHREKIKELKRILMSHKIGGTNRAKVVKEYAHLTERMNQALTKEEKFQAINEFFQSDELDHLIEN